MSLFRTLSRPLPASILAALVYGSWAFWLAIDASFSIAIRAATIQAFCAALATLLLALILSFCAKNWPNLKLFFWLATVLVLGSVPFGLHSLSGTPLPSLTILPGWIIGSGYSALLLRQPLS